MSRVQLALNVTDIDSAIHFYSKLFNMEPSKRKSGYANFAVEDPPLKLVLIENPTATDHINHLGVEVTSIKEVEHHRKRLVDAGLRPRDEMNVTCCYAHQDKFWVYAPDFEGWEHYLVLGDSDSFGRSSENKEVLACC